MRRAVHNYIRRSVHRTVVKKLDGYTPGDTACPGMPCITLLYPNKGTELGGSDTLHTNGNSDVPLIYIYDNYHVVNRPAWH